MFSKREGILVSKLGAETHGPGRGQENKLPSVLAAGRKTSFPQSRPQAEKRKIHSPVAGEKTRSPQPGRGRTLNMALR